MFCFLKQNFKFPQKSWWAFHALYKDALPLLSHLPGATEPSEKVTQVSTCDSCTERSLLLSVITSVFSAHLSPQ